MRVTAEVRWFYEDRLPVSVADWFRGLPGTWREEGIRVDRYLYPTHPALNVKLREGAVEVKRRDVGGEPVVFAQRVRGTLEQWRKWSLPGIEDQALAEATPPYWAAVRKQRFRRIYRVDEAAGVVPVKERDEPPQGCELELARLEIDGVFWWTLCLEAFGEEAMLRDVLVQTATHLFAVGLPPVLAADHAAGYPAWLMQTLERNSRI